MEFKKNQIGKKGKVGRDGQTEGQMDGQMDGRTDARREGSTLLLYSENTATGCSSLFLLVMLFCK